MNCIGKDSTVGVIGLGIMGSSFASNLLNRGYQVHIHNRTKDKARQLIEKGATFHSTPRELASVSDIVMTSLTDQDAVDAVAFGDEGFLKGLKRGKMWIDLSTIDPVASVKHADIAKQASIQRLDAPVVGSKAAALSGDLIVLVGGSEETFSNASGFLNDVGKTVIYLGEDGNGHRMKLAVNLYLALVAESYSESLTLARKLGLEGKAFVDTINQTPHKNYFTEGKGPKIVAKDFQPNFTLDNLFKDLRLVNEQIKRTGADLPLTGTAIGQYADAVKGGQGKKDYSVIALEVQRKNGLE
jgi:3-hydroxyisobutyrate dehydrogenase-like beta-hydroxyacid dehydrogenase